MPVDHPTIANVSGTAVRDRDAIRRGQTLSTNNCRIVVSPVGHDVAAMTPPLTPGGVIEAAAVAGRNMDQIKLPTGEIVDPRALPGPSKLPPMSAVERPSSRSLIPQKLPKKRLEERNMALSA
jgi:hypothetical protein